MRVHRTRHAHCRVISCAQQAPRKTTVKPDLHCRRCITKLKLEREGIDFNIVQRDVKRLIAGCVVVGHSLDYDFKVLNLDHPDEDVIDTSRIDPFKSLTNKGHTPGLKFLAQRFLNVNIQQGQHSSITDAKVAMKLSLMAIPKRQ
ncbi:RNA exonuclease 4-like isoform X2 [Galleria mellonella]|uniref:RNA exonuclease 4-like isoform X2 n=1 Tax=Galleria mellonella TaxID=7137 RepID=A0ABM3MAF2_GALME|nr:RNA exonuclease 4-like isoform X2 [Galleria mellonella]